MPVSDIKRAKNKARYNACMVKEWLPRIESECDATGENPFERLQTYVDEGLLLHAAEPGYVHHDAPIHKGDISVAISKAKLARRMIEAGVPNEVAPDAMVPVYWRTAHEFQLSLFDLWIARSELKKVCQSLGKRDLPWPDEETGFALQLKIGALQIERDRIAVMPATAISEEATKSGLLKEIDSKIAALQAEFDRVLPPDGLVGTNQPNTVRAETDCKRWLVDLMRGAQARVRDDCQSEAMLKFAGLSVRAFQRAWRNAITHKSAI